MDLGGHRVHMLCTGKGRPTVVVENGFYEFSFDWALVRTRVSAFARICTYDRAGHAWSDPGPLPRTFDQITLGLRDGLARLGEDGPFVLVGHSFGGPVVRQQQLARLSRQGRQVIVPAGHDMHLEAPDTVARAIADVVDAARRAPAGRRPPAARPPAKAGVP